MPDEPEDYVIDDEARDVPSMTFVTGRITIPAGSIEITVADNRVKDDSSVLANTSGARDATMTRIEDVRVAAGLITIRGNASATAPVVVNYMLVV